MYDLQIEFPPPPIPRDRTFEIVERVAATGDVVVQPTSVDLRTLTNRTPRRPTSKRSGSAS